MAIQRIAYSCSFKCGRRVVLQKSIIEAHEVNCLSNPENKACKTCKHYETYQDSSGESLDSWIVKQCNHDNEYDVNEMRVNCEHHEDKNGNS